MADLPPNLAGQAASAIVRKAEDLKKADQLEKQRIADQRRRQEQAMREAAARKRQQDSGKH